MRILVLSKRQYTGKDLLDDRYGRLYEIPAALAARGHEVVGVALSYRRRAVGWYRRDDLPGLTWLAINALPVGLWQYPRRLAAIVATLQPDIIWACSDAFHAIAGAALSRVTGIPLVIDLYDNFESFTATRVPGVSPLFRAACRRASGLSVVSQALRNYVISAYELKTPVVIIGNGICNKLFYPRNQREARLKLGLPVNAQLIGTAGAINAGRDIAVLFDAFLQLMADNPLLYLVFAGPRDATPSRYRHPRILDLGVLPYESIPEFYSALDVAVICNRDSAFGRYCFPQKLHEIMACHTPLVAAEVGDMRELLIDHPDSLYQPSDSSDLAEKIRKQLVSHLPIDRIFLTWLELGKKLEDFLRTVVK